MFLLSTDYVNNQNIVTHCDKKSRGKVGGSAISVYQALLHPHIESLGTRLLPMPLYTMGDLHLIKVLLKSKFHNFNHY